MGIPYAEVIGDPVAHSKSPMIHKFWLEKLGLAGDFRATRVGSGELPDYLAERRADADWRGCSLTMPLKEEAVGHVDRIEGALDRIGALNAIVARQGMLIGTNTDTAGALEALIAAKATMPLAVIGAGGAARAVCLALSAYVPEMTVINRDVGRAERMIADLGIAATVRGFDQPLPPAGLLVNASAWGMRGRLPFPLPLDPLPTGAVVVDIVYEPLETPLLAAARARGLRTVDGLVMLIGQAATSFAMFFERAAPRAHDAELREKLTS